MKGVSGKQLNDIYMCAWKPGLKTTYYLRTSWCNVRLKNQRLMQKNLALRKNVNMARSKVHVRRIAEARRQKCDNMPVKPCS